MTEAERRIRAALSVASIEPRDECFKVDTDDLTALLADRDEREAALRAEVEALKSDNDSYREAANGYLAEVEALEREVEALRADAERYRHVRQNPAMLLHLRNSEFDSAIDAALAHAKDAEARG